MNLPAMQRTNINGVALELWDHGAGEPVVFVHGGMGDECFAVLAEPALTGRYRLIHYHRRGWGQSEHLAAPLTMAEQAADCRAVMRHLGVARAHVVGQSYGGAIALQMALDAPGAVHTLALLEPSLPAAVFSASESGAATATVRSAARAKALSLYEAGDKARAIDTLFQEVCGADYRATFDRTLPPGSFDRWVADADTLFRYDIPALASWMFTRAEAAHIGQPVLNLCGANTRRSEVYETLQAWLPQAENVVLPEATHAMLQTNPQGAAERLANFFARHPLPG